MGCTPRKCGEDCEANARKIETLERALHDVVAHKSVTAEQRKVLYAIAFGDRCSDCHELVDTQAPAGCQCYRYELGC